MASGRADPDRWPRACAAGAARTAAPTVAATPIWAGRLHSAAVSGERFLCRACALWLAGALDGGPAGALWLAGAPGGGPAWPP